MQIRLIIFFLLVTFSKLAFGQISFYKTFTNNGYDVGQGVVQLEDSSYLITGSSSSFNTLSTQAFLLKLDSLGNKLWSKDYGGAEADWGRRVLYKKNFGCFIAGYTNSIGQGGYDAYLVKTSVDGDFEWEKAYGTSGWEKIHDAVMLADTGVLMVGETISLETDDKNIYFIRTDKEGDTLWTKIIPNSGEDFAKAVKVLDDTTVIVCGQRKDFLTGKKKAFVMRMNSNTGLIYWDNLYGDEGDNCFNDFVFWNNTINLVGYRTFDSGAIYGTTVRVDMDGVFVLEQLSGSNDYSYDNIVQYGSGSDYYIAYTYWNTSFTFPEGKDLDVYKFNFGFYWLNSGVHCSATGDDISGQLIETSDGGAFMVGYNTSFGPGGNNVMVLKIGPEDLYPATDEPPASYDLVGIETMDLESSLTYSVFPSPSKSQLYFQQNENFFDEIQIMDLLGNVLVRQPMDQLSVQLDVSKIAAGYYFAQFKKSNQIFVSKPIEIRH
jgi:hypothetical protein